MTRTEENNWRRTMARIVLWIILASGMLIVLGSIAAHAGECLTKRQVWDRGEYPRWHIVNGSKCWHGKEHHHRVVAVKHKSASPGMAKAVLPDLAAPARPISMPSQTATSVGVYISPATILAFAPPGWEPIAPRLTHEEFLDRYRQDFPTPAQPKPIMAAGVDHSTAIGALVTLAVIGFSAMVLPWRRRRAGKAQDGRFLVPPVAELPKPGKPWTDPVGAPLPPWLAAGPDTAIIR